MLSPLFAVILESSCLRDPAAAFLGFAKRLSPFFSCMAFIFSNCFFDIYTSPLTIRSPLYGINIGISFMVLRFSLTSSPMIPFPLVPPLTNTPPEYSRDTERPSILYSTTYCGSIPWFRILESNSSISSFEKALDSESICLAC